MAMIIKTRARVPLERCAVSSVGLYPAGVGGMGSSEPCVMFYIGAHKVILTANGRRLSLCARPHRRAAMRLPLQ